MRLVERSIDLDPLVMSRSRVDRSTDKLHVSEAAREKERERSRKWRKEHPGRHAELARQWRAKHKEYYLAWQQVHRKEYQVTHREIVNRLSRNYRKRLRKLVIEHYGGVCACCGETEFGFLTIHHINNDGAEHRRQIKKDIYQWLKNNGFPDGFEPRCYNCNCGMEYNGGVCPHENSRTTN